MTRRTPRLRPGRKDRLRWPRRLVRGLGALRSAVPCCRGAGGVDGARALDRDVTSYQPYWSLRVHLLRLEGADDDAIAAYRQAVGLGESPVVRDFLAREVAAVKGVM